MLPTGWWRPEAPTTTKSDEMFRTLVKYGSPGATRSAAQDWRGGVIAADAARVCYAMPNIPGLEQSPQQRRVEEIKLRMLTRHRVTLARARAHDLDQQWFRLCLHEMAHAHVAHRFGAANPVEIRVNGGLHGGGHTRFKGTNLVATIAVAQAGGIAERLVFGTAEGCKGDHAKLREYVEALGWDADDARIKIVRRMTKRIVAAGLADIVRAAEQLTRPGTYTVSRWRSN
jgi:hypothetical protein